MDEKSVCRHFRLTADDGKNYETNHYNLDVIISVGYRVKSVKGTKFRIWATQRLKEYIIKGFTLNDDRFKSGSSMNYFNDLQDRIREIRLSEKFFYQKIKGIDATSIDWLQFRFNETYCIFTSSNPDKEWKNFLTLFSWTKHLNS